MPANKRLFRFGTIVCFAYASAVDNITILVHFSLIISAAGSTISPATPLPDKQTACLRQKRVPGSNPKDPAKRRR